MEQTKLSDLYGACVPFRGSDLYRRGACTDLLLARKLLLEFLSPEERRGLDKTLAVLEETYREETDLAACYYFTCGVRAGEQKGQKETVFDL